MSHGLFARLYATRQPFALIDARDRRSHVEGHWFGSTNVPLDDMARRLPRLVPERGFPIHLLDWQDPASWAAAQMLAQLGYTQVTLCPTQVPKDWGQGFIRGEYSWSKAFGEVVAHSVDLPEVTPADYLRDHAGALLLDVRPTAEYAQFTLPGSQSLPNSLMLANLDRLKGEGRAALLHCAGRTRSIIGAATLRAAGFDGPFAVFRGGTQAWQLDGHDREHGADRVFAAQGSDPQAVLGILSIWGIPCDVVGPDGLAALLAKTPDAAAFDVSDDGARGRAGPLGIWRISGTNLVQQTDQSLARYHVPLVLVDHGSGSRAAFAAFWLRAMGFAVRVALLSAPLPEAEAADSAPSGVSAVEVLAHRDAGGAIWDMRPSTAFEAGHLRGSIYAPLSGRVAVPAGQEPVTLICADATQAKAAVQLLTRHGQAIAGHHIWHEGGFATDQITTARLDRTPPDRVTLFAGRHHGNMQNSRDYLAWEEALPEEIDAPLVALWQNRLAGL